jgi:uncharacterized RDD family membrane protein YckC
MNKANTYKTEPNIGSRFLAGLVDYIIILTFTFVMLKTFGAQNSEGTYELNGLPGLIPIIFWGIMTIGSEQLFGVTLGNYTMDLKPISINGTQQNLTFSQSLKRHILDPVDMSLFGLIGIITIKNTEKNQRLGDLWAKTIVLNMKKNSELNNPTAE